MGRFKKESDDANEPAGFAYVPPKQKTLKEALEELKDNPRAVTFNSTQAAGYGLIVGHDLIKFQKSEFRTSNPDEIEALMSSDRYGFDFFVLDDVLRKAKR